MPPILRAMLATMLLMLASCDDEAASPPEVSGALQSIVRQDADGNTTEFTRFDYENGKLVRIRYYDDAGDDGKFGTADDVMSKWIACSVEVIGNPLLEFQVSAFPLGIPESCEHNGLQANRIESIYFNNPGADGLWLTNDDVRSGAAVITRTASGSHYTYTEANCEDCRNTEAHIEYLFDDSNRLIGTNRGGKPLTRNHYSPNMRLAAQDLMDSHPFVARVAYLYTRKTTEIKMECLISDYDSLAGSSTAQIWLAIFGCPSYTEEYVTIDGVQYSRFQPLSYYIRITHLSGNSLKIEHGSSGAVTRLRYGQP